MNKLSKLKCVDMKYKGYSENGIDKACTIFMMKIGIKMQLNKLMVENAALNETVMARPVTTLTSDNNSLDIIIR